MADVQARPFWFLAALDLGAACSRMAHLVDQPFSIQFLIFLQKWNQPTLAQFSLSENCKNRKFIFQESLYYVSM